MFSQSYRKAVSQSEELMKGLSHSMRTFSFVGIDAKMSPDLVTVLFERVWFNVLTLGSSILGNVLSPLAMITKCLDMLRACISTSLFLNIRTAREAFMSQLAKLKFAQDQAIHSNAQNTLYFADESYKKEQWYVNVEHAAERDDPWCVLGELHLLVNTLKDNVEKQQSEETLASVLARINLHRSSKLLENTRNFIREADMAKKCRSRYRTYRFFLFNDQLLYADRSMSGKWNVHNALRLRLTRISNISDGLLHKNAFQILNPVKSFVVQAESQVEKREWVRDLEMAILEANKSHSTRRLSLRIASEDRKAFEIELENGDSVTLERITEER